MGARSLGFSSALIQEVDPWPPIRSGAASTVKRSLAAERHELTQHGSISDLPRTPHLRDLQPRYRTFSLPRLWTRSACPIGVISILHLIRPCCRFGRFRLRYRRSAGRFNVHAGVAPEADDRPGLDRLCPYIARPPIAIERLELTPGGNVRYHFRKPWRNGTAYVDYSP